MTDDYPILRIRQIGNRFEFELINPSSMQITQVHRKKAKFSNSLKKIMATYRILVNIAGCKESMSAENRELFEEMLTDLCKETGSIFSDVLGDLGFDFRKKGNLALALDNQTVKIPWELGHIKNPQNGNVCMLCDQFSIGRLRVVEGEQWYNSLDLRRKNRALVVGNNYGYAPKRRIRPLTDAENEANAVAKILIKNGFNEQDVKVLTGPQVTKKAILEELKNGVDVFHFTGHGVMSRNNSRLILNNTDLSAKDFKDSTRYSAPRFTFFNACESSIDSPKNDKTAVVPNNWAYAMATQGGRVFIGTLWSVCEPSSTDFAKTVYQEFFGEKKPLAEALRSARDETFLKETCKKYTDEPTNYTWPGYMLYGVPTTTKQDILR
jgi:CHAT domain-containing protein